LPAAVAAATLVSWIVTVDRMQGMDAGPGTSLGGLGWFIGVWATMMAAMMLPSLLPITLGFASVSSRQQRRGRILVPTGVFISGWLAPSNPVTPRRHCIPSASEREASAYRLRAFCAILPV
jgi:hypothetical protein